MERTEVNDIAELKIRQYFDDYLTNVFPSQVKQLIELHDSDDKAHGAVERRFDKTFWVMIGVAFAGGGAGALVGKVLTVAAGG